MYIPTDGDIIGMLLVFLFLRAVAKEFREHG